MKIWKQDFSLEGLNNFRDNTLVGHLDITFTDFSENSITAEMPVDERTRLFDICRTLKPSDRGELEITDVNNEYVRRGTLTSEKLEGWRPDAGTFESLYRSSTLVREAGANRMDL